MVRTARVMMVVPGSLPEQHRLHHRNKRGVHKVDRCDCSDRQIQIRQIQKDLCRYRPENAVQRDLRQTAQFDGWGLRRMQPARSSRSMPQPPRPTSSVATDMDSFVASLMSAAPSPYKSAEAVANTAPLKRVFSIFLSDVKKSYALRRMPPVVRRRHTQRRIWAVSSWYSISSRSRRMASSAAKYAALLS